MKDPISFWSKPHFVHSTIVAIATVAFLFQSEQSTQAATVPHDVMADTWVATDPLGRTLPDHSDVGSPKADRFVGMFYFLWLGEHGTSGPHNTTEILAANPSDPAWGPLNAFHHWEKPLLGYYLSDDAYVMRKHIQMLSDAGIDVLITDNTNGFPYADNYNLLLDVLHDMRQAGNRVPQIAFFANASAGATAFADLYRSGAETWDPAHHVDHVEVADGVLSFDVTDADPFLYSPSGLGIDASSRTVLHLRMRNHTAGGGAQLFWITESDGGWDQAKSLLFPVSVLDADFQDVAVDLTAAATWAGAVTQLRLDPVAGVTGRVEIDSIGLTTAGGADLKEWTFSGDHHPDLWFRWENKPLILITSGSIDDVPAEMAAFFTIRKTWGLQTINEPNEWPFMQLYPQDAGYSAAEPSVDEFMVVSIAQQESYMTAPTAHGRSYHDGQEPPENERDDTGMNFAEQWDRALSFDPKFIFVTGWNEWTAQRFEDAGGNTRFVDSYSKEFSRDIEPMDGGYTTTYYYQLVDYVRRHKGVRPLPVARGEHAITIDGAFADWAAVSPEFLDTLDDPVARNHAGWGSAGPYVNTTGRNDFVALKVAVDDNVVCFYARTSGTLTSRAGLHWMNLFIDIDQDPATGWEGYDYLLNRTAPGAATATLEAHTGPGWAWTVAATVSHAIAGNELEIAIPKSALAGLSEPPEFDFKWADNYQAEGDILEFTLNGDSAPNDRSNYRFSFAHSPALIIH